MRKVYSGGMRKVYSGGLRKVYSGGMRKVYSGGMRKVYSGGLRKDRPVPEAVDDTCTDVVLRTAARNIPSMSWSL